MTEQPSPGAVAEYADRIMPVSYLRAVCESCDIQRERMTTKRDTFAAELIAAGWGLVESGLLCPDCAKKSKKGSTE